MAAVGGRGSSAGRNGVSYNSDSDSDSDYSDSDSEFLNFTLANQDGDTVHRNPAGR